MKTNGKKTSAEVTENICAMVSDRLISMMERGVNPWRKPWSECPEDVAVSHTNGKPYSLLNQILLRFRSGEYLTFNQVKKEGGNVKKGAKSEVIVFWQSGGLKSVAAPPKEGRKPEDETESENGRETQWVAWKSPVLKYFHVFHIDDCEGIKPRFADKKIMVTYPTNPIEAADEVAHAYCDRNKVILVIQKSNRAFYRPLTDVVTVPLMEQFEKPEEYYSTLFHELTHSTGHTSRLNRFKEESIFNARENYSREGLIAEIGSAACLTRLGIENKHTEEQSAAYLQHWAQFLKSDPRAFVIAAGKAEKAVNLIFDEQ